MDGTGIARTFRAEYGRAVSVLYRMLGDLDRAEDAVQEAFVVATERWPRDGVPPSPAGWIITTARRRAIDRLRRDAVGRDREAEADAAGFAHRPGAAGRIRRRTTSPTTACASSSRAAIPRSRPRRAWL